MSSNQTFNLGNLTLKAYTKSERVLRFEAVVHNTRDLGCGRMIERFPDIVARLVAMLQRFMTVLDCVDASLSSVGPAATRSSHRPSVLSLHC